MARVLTHMTIPDPNHPKEKAEAIYDLSFGRAVFAGWVWPADSYTFDGITRPADGYSAQFPHQTAEDEVDHFMPHCSRGDRGTAVWRLLNSARHKLAKETT